MNDQHLSRACAAAARTSQPDRTAAPLQLIAAGTLLLSLAVALTAVSIGVSRSDGSMPITKIVG